MVGCGGHAQPSRCSLSEIAGGALDVCNLLAVAGFHHLLHLRKRSELVVEAHQPQQVLGPGLGDVVGDAHRHGGAHPGLLDAGAEGQRATHRVSDEADAVAVHVGSAGQVVQRSGRVQGDDGQQVLAQQTAVFAGSSPAEIERDCQHAPPHEFQDQGQSCFRRTIHRLADQDSGPRTAAPVNMVRLEHHHAERHAPRIPQGHCVAVERRQAEPGQQGNQGR